MSEGRERGPAPRTRLAHSAARSLVSCAHSTAKVSLDLVPLDGEEVRDANRATPRSGGLRAWTEDTALVARGAACATVVDAFLHPPYRLLEWTSHGARTSELRAELLPEVVRWSAEYCMGEAVASGGWVVTARDPASGEMLGTALVAHVDQLLRGAPVWRAAERARAFLGSAARQPFPPALQRPFRYGLNAVVRALALTQLEDERVAAVDSLPESAPRYVYLQQLATRPKAQKRGVGSALLRAVTAIADELGEGCYLETDEEHLRALYEKHGFVVHHTYVVSAGGGSFAPNYAMVRPVTEFGAVAGRANVVESAGSAPPPSA